MKLHLQNAIQRSGQTEPVWGTYKLVQYQLLRTKRQKIVNDMKEIG